jgi:hypothetical protein
VASISGVGVMAEWWPAVLPVLAVLGALVGSVVASVCLAACASAHWSGVSSRIGRLFRSQEPTSQNVHLTDG